MTISIHVVRNILICCVGGAHGEGVSKYQLMFANILFAHAMWLLWLPWLPLGWLGLVWAEFIFPPEWSFPLFYTHDSIPVVYCNLLGRPCPICCYSISLCYQ